jgi:anti-sigma B factor antagonist
MFAQPVPRMHHDDQPQAGGPIGVLRSRTLLVGGDGRRMTVATVVDAIGEFDASNAAELRELLLCELGKASVVVVDLSGTTFIDSTVLGALVAGRRRAGLVSGALRLVAPTRNVARVLQITALNRVFSIYPDIDAALAAP